MRSLTLLLAFLISISAFGDQGPKLLHSVGDISFYGVGIPAEDEDLAKISAEKKFNFLTNQVISKIPMDIQKMIAGKQIIFAYIPNYSRDGIFVDPSSLSVNSNNKALIALNYKTLLSDGGDRILAHEYFHFLHFHLDPNQEVWIREGLAQLFEYLITGDLNGSHIRAQYQNPFVNFFDPYNISDSTRELYGQHLLYFYYLYTRCGRDDLLWDIAQNKPLLKGRALVDAVLDQVRLVGCDSFDDTFIDFQVARFHNKTILNNEGQLSDQFRILSTTIKMPKAQISQLKLDRDYGAYLVSPSTLVRLGEEVHSLDVFWLQKTFPYSVINSKEIISSNPDFWDVLLISK